jgi:hypothetical protein
MRTSRRIHQLFIAATYRNVASPIWKSVLENLNPYLCVGIQFSFIVALSGRHHTHLSRKTRACWAHQAVEQEKLRATTGMQDQYDTYTKHD